MLCVCSYSCFLTNAPCSVGQKLSQEPSKVTMHVHFIDIIAREMLYTKQQLCEDCKLIFTNNSHDPSKVNMYVHFIDTNAREM